MFADHTNLFHEHKNIMKPFAQLNKELMNINYWFMVNKLSLSVSLCLSVRLSLSLFL